jgi:RND family efflux transporter MFP subunit
MKNGIKNLALFTLWLFAAGSPAVAQDQPQWIEASEQPIPLKRVINGEVEAVNKATISAQTSGRVSAIHYDVDDFVPKGAIVVELTNTEQKAALRQAEANLEAVQAQFKQAKADYERIKDLFAKKLVSKSDLDKATSRYNALKAQIEAARAAVERARKQFEYTVIRAPYDGIVTNRYVEVGETVHPGKPIMSGISLDKLRVVAHIPESIILQVKKSMKAEVILPTGQRAPAKKITIFPYADPATRTFKARIDIEVENAELYPGMTTKVEFELGTKKAVVIPAKAVIRRSELSLVFVKNGEEILLRQVRTGDRLGDKVEIISGLRPGELVALDPWSIEAQRR